MEFNMADDIENPSPENQQLIAALKQYAEAVRVVQKKLEGMIKIARSKPEGRPLNDACINFDSVITQILSQCPAHKLHVLEEECAKLQDSCSQHALSQ